MSESIKNHTEPKNKNDEITLNQSLKEASNILKKVEKEAPKLYDKFKLEYEQLVKSVNNARGETKEVSKELMTQIKLELSDIFKLANDKGIGKDKLSFDYYFGEDNESKLEKSSSDLREKNIEDMSLEEAKGSLIYLNNNYNNYDDAISEKAEELLETFSSTDTINNIDTKAEVNIFQEKLIKIIIGEDHKGFTNQYITGFNSNEKGHYLQDIGEFVLQIKEAKTDIRNINSKALGNYFKYLNSIGMESKYFIEIFGENILFQLSELWNNPKGSDGLYAKEELEKTKFGPETIKYISMFSSPQEFINGIGTLDEEQRETALSFLDQNLSSIKEKFESELLELVKENNPGMPEVKRKKIVSEMLGRLGEIKHINGLNGLKDLYIVFNEYNEKYHLGLSLKGKAEEFLKIQKKEAQSEILKTYNLIEIAKTNGDKEGIQLLTSKLERFESTLLILDASTEFNNYMELDDIKKIISGEVDFKEYVNYLRRTNEELNSKLEKIEKEKEIINKLEKIDSREYSKDKSSSYYIETIPEQNGDNTNLTINGKTIEGITGKEYNSIIEIDNNGNRVIKNPEALKNLVDFKEKMELLNLGFVWKYRDTLITEAKRHPEYSRLNNLDNDLINKTELNKLLNFVLTLIGEKGNPNSLKGTYAKVIELNGGGMLNNKTNTLTGFGNIGQKFYELGYIGRNSIDTNNINNIRNYKGKLLPQKN